MEGKQKLVHTREASIWKKDMNIWRKGTAIGELCLFVFYLLPFNLRAGRSLLSEPNVEIQSNWLDKPEDRVQDKHACWRVRGEPWQ